MESSDPFTRASGGRKIGDEEWSSLSQGQLEDLSTKRHHSGSYINRQIGERAAQELEKRRAAALGEPLGAIRSATAAIARSAAASDRLAGRVFWLTVAVAVLAVASVVVAVVALRFPVSP